MTRLADPWSVVFSRCRKRWWAVMGFAWLGAIVYTWSVLASHAYQPSKSADLADATIRMEASDSFRIVMFAHPFCPCTRATLHELDESMRRLPRDISVSVVFMSAGLDASDVAQSPLVDFAKQLRGVTVRIDETETEASRFGATISGEVFAFDPAGKLIYHGGLTPGRGHHGDALGQEQLERIIRGESQNFCSAPVYGCRLPGK